MKVRTALLVVAAVACASPGIPPGGPPDADAPQLVRIVPDSNAVNVSASAVLLHFNEVISERPGSVTGAAGGGFGVATGGIANAAGGSALAAIVNISPSDGRERVEWRRTAIEIRPRRGFRANTTYRVSVQPGIADLRGNVLRAPLEFVFSTGSEIPTSRVVGVVFDWAAARPAALARVEVFPHDDSTFRWSARADSSGRFSVRDLAPGSYAIRAWLDGDNDRRLGLRESFDSATVTLDTLGKVELYAFVQDTLWPRIESVDVSDSTAVRVGFDRVVAADWVSAGAVSIVGADSVARPLEGFVPRDRLDSLRKAISDTAAADSTDVSVDAPPAPPSTTPGGARPPTATTPGAAPGAAPTGIPVAPGDSAAPSVPPPIFGRATPIQLWAAPLDAPLAPGVYRLRITNVRGLNGRTHDTDREFRVREPPPRPPTPPPTDTTAVVPATPVPSTLGPPVRRPR